MTKMVDDQIQSKVHQYETFLNEVLKEKLKCCLEARTGYCSEIEEYLQLQKTIKGLGELDTKPLKTKVDLGCGFFVQAEVPDTSKILIAVGFGFFLELTAEEACTFISKKVDLLNEKVKFLEEESSHISADIKMMLNNLGQLQGLINPNQS
nr:EOG090X0MWD [Ilyocryptus agilis]